MDTQALKLEIQECLQIMIKQVEFITLGVLRAHSTNIDFYRKSFVQSWTWLD